MSPNEFDLRAALHEGEGDSVDADRLIAHAVGVRHARRVRLATIAAAVVAVGGIGVGATVLTEHSHRQMAEKSSGTGSAASASAANGGAYAATAAGAPPAASVVLPTDGAMRDPQPDMALSTQCPQTPPRLMLPGGGGSGQFGSTGPLFPGPVANMSVCGYAGGTGSAVPAPVPLVLDAKQAATVAASLNAASTTVPAKMCPAEPPGYRPTQLVLMAVGTDGKAMEPVVVTSGCIGKATNGTAVRYDWQPPALLSAFIAKLEATPVSSAQLPSSASPSFAAPPAPSASPRVSGSPAR